MTAIEVKTEIQKALNEVPDNILPDILTYIKQIKHLSSDEVKLNNNLRKILSEDREFLEKLAQ